MCVCVHACVHACVRACMRVCVLGGMEGIGKKFWTNEFSSSGVGELAG